MQTLRDNAKGSSFKLCDYGNAQAKNDIIQMHKKRNTIEYLCVFFIYKI